MRKLAVLILVFLFGATMLANVVYAREFEIDHREKVGYVNVDYFDRFGDELLKCYILKAVENNHSAREASYKSEEFREQVKKSFGDQLPSLSTSPSYLGLHVGGRLSMLDIPKNIFILPFILNYEADFLLKNRDKTRSVRKIYESTEFQEQTAYISLSSDVATLYTNILKTNKMIELQRELVIAREQYLGYGHKKLSRGTISQNDVNTYGAQLNRARADLEDLEKSRQILLTQFAFLLGESPNNANDFVFGRFDNLHNAKAPDEIPSDVIFSRPDVLSIERQLEGAKIDTTVARKELFPKFNVLGNYAFTTIGPGNFFGWDSTVAAILAGASQDIFKGGKIANIKMKKSKYMQLFEEYKEIELQALKDVNDALYQIKFDEKITSESFRELSYRENTLHRDSKKLIRGTISGPDYLSQKMTKIESEQNHVTKKANQIIDNFTLYKAVGGKI